MNTKTAPKKTLKTLKAEAKEAYHLRSSKEGSHVVVADGIVRFRSFFPSACERFVECYGSGEIFETARCTKTGYSIGVVASDGEIMAIVSRGLSLDEAEREEKRFTVGILAPGVTVTNGESA